MGTSLVFLFGLERANTSWDVHVHVVVLSRSMYISIYDIYASTRIGLIDRQYKQRRNLYEYSRQNLGEET
jgi:hypothetical protein